MSVFRAYIFFITIAIATAQQPAAGTIAPPPEYQTLRQQEDWSVMRDESRMVDWSDRLKYIRLGQRDGWYMSAGGDIRPYYERFRNEEWGGQPQDLNGFFLQRYMLHADVHFGSSVRVFGQLKSNFENGRKGGPRPSDEDKLDVHQAFLDIKWNASAKRSFVLRMGRQELEYGSSRLVSVREGPNVRQSFDGVRALTRVQDWQIDLFAVRPVQTNRGYFDDSPDHKRALWGVYAVRPTSFVLARNIDLYYLGFSRTDARFDQGEGKELRHTLGTRLWGNVQGWDYNTEFTYQLGTFGPGQIRAWAAASETGYTFENVPLKPHPMIKANITSGDRNPDDRDLQTFNSMFPKGAYFGQLSPVGLSNHRDLHPAVELSLPRNVNVMLDWIFYWRHSTRDGIYAISGNLVRTGQISRARYIGHQPEIEVRWQMDRHTEFALSYARFLTGRFLAETPPGRNTTYFALWMTYKF